MSNELWDEAAAREWMTEPSATFSREQIGRIEFLRDADYDRALAAMVEYYRATDEFDRTLLGFVCRHSGEWIPFDRAASSSYARTKWQRAMRECHGISRETIQAAKVAALRPGVLVKAEMMTEPERRKTERAWPVSEARQSPRR